MSPRAYCLLLLLSATATTSTSTMTITPTSMTMTYMPKTTLLSNFRLGSRAWLGTLPSHAHCEPDPRPTPDHCAAHVSSSTCSTNAVRIAGFNAPSELPAKTVTGGTSVYCYDLSSWWVQGAFASTCRRIQLRHALVALAIPNILEDTTSIDYRCWYRPAQVSPPSQMELSRILRVLRHHELGSCRSSIPEWTCSHGFHELPLCTRCLFGCACAACVLCQPKWPHVAPSICIDVALDYLLVRVHFSHERPAGLPAIEPFWRYRFTISFHPTDL